MIHLGDITKISGRTAPVVDVIIGGSPCQDLSMAGKRVGLAGERSGLYMEQIRIIKEMRENDRLRGRSGVMVRPRYMVWENVPGAFSSNHGEDFAAVLEEAIRVAEPEAPSVPVPEKGWPTSGVVMGDSWSVAWRVLDAQFWGVPQRRRRIALVADFGGLSAPEILFVREGVCGNPQPCESPREETAGDAGEGTACTMQVRCGCDGGAREHSSSGTSQQPSQQVTSRPCSNQTAEGGSIAYSELKCDGAVMIENHPADSRVKIDESGTCQTLTSRMGTGGGNVPLVGIMEDGND